MKYVDGFVIPIAKKNIPTYKKMAALGCKVWLKHGALEYRECVGEDLAVQMGMPFTKAFKAKPGETIVFAWIVYKSRKHRDQVNAKVMKDESMLAGMEGKKMPFDVKRMCYGGFEIIVES